MAEQLRLFNARKYDDVELDDDWTINPQTGAIENESLGVYVKHSYGKLPVEKAMSLHKFNDYTCRLVSSKSKMVPSHVRHGDSIYYGKQWQGAKAHIEKEFVIAIDEFETDRKIVTLSSCFKSSEKLRCGTPVWNFADNFAGPITQGLFKGEFTYYGLSTYTNTSWTFSANYEIKVKEKTAFMVCGDREFNSREELVEYKQNLPKKKVVCLWLKGKKTDGSFTGLQISVIDGEVEVMNHHFDTDILGVCNVKLTPTSASVCDSDSEEQQQNDIELRFGDIKLKRIGWTSAHVWRKTTDVGSDHIEGPDMKVENLRDGDEIVFQHKPDTKLMREIVKSCTGRVHRKLTMYFPNGHDVNFSQIFGYQDGLSLIHKMQYARTLQSASVTVVESADGSNYACNLCSCSFNINEQILVHDCDIDNNLKLANAIDFLGMDVVMVKLSVEQLSVATDLENTESHNDKIKAILTAERDGTLTEWTKHEYHHGIVNNWNITTCSEKFKNMLTKVFGVVSQPHDSLIRNGDVEITNQDCVGVAEIRFGLVNKGNAGICDGTLSTNYHNTNGKDLHVMKTGHEVSLKVVHQDKDEDLAVFKKLRNYKKPEHGKVYLAMGYLSGDKPSLYPMLCAYSSGTTERALFLPCNLVNDVWEVVEGYSWYGLSGAPIFDVDGEQVGIFGRGFVLNSIQDCKPGVVMSASTLPAQKGVQEKVFTEAAKIISSERAPEGMRGFLIVASTGAGKTMRLTRNLMLLNQDKKILCLIPSRDSCRAAFNGFCKLNNDEMRKLNWKIRLELGEKDQEQSIVTMGNGMTELTFMTYGKFVTLTEARTNSFAHILLDEFHVRNDDTVNVDLKLGVMNTKATLTVMTATDIGFKHWYKPIQDVVVQRRFMISEKHVKDIKCDNGIKVGAGDEEKLGDYKGTPLPIEWFEQRTIVFVPTISLCNKVSTYIKAQKNAPHVVVFNSMNRVDITTLPEKCIIVATDVIESSVTIPNCMLVIDYQKQNTIQRNMSVNNKIYSCENVIVPATSSSVQQRMGRTGRTCDGIYVKMSDEELTQQSMYPEAVLINLGADYTYPDHSAKTVELKNALSELNTYHHLADTCKARMEPNLRSFKTADWNMDRWTNILSNTNTLCFKEINESTKYDPYVSVHKDLDKRIAFLKTLQYEESVAEANAKNKEKTGWYISSIAITDPELREREVKRKAHKQTPEIAEAQFSALGLGVTATASLGVILALINKYLEKNSKRNIVRAHTTSKEQFVDALMQLKVEKTKSTKFMASEYQALKQAISKIKTSIGEFANKAPETQVRESLVTAEERAMLTNALEEDCVLEGKDPKSPHIAAEIERTVAEVAVQLEEAKRRSIGESDSELEAELELIMEPEVEDAHQSPTNVEEEQRLALLSTLRKKSLSAEQAYDLLCEKLGPHKSSVAPIDYVTLPEVVVENCRVYYKFDDSDAEATSAVAILATTDGI